MNRLKTALAGVMLASAILIPAVPASACPVTVCGGTSPHRVVFRVDGWTCTATFFTSVPHYFRVRCIHQ